MPCFSNSRCDLLARFRRPCRAGCVEEFDHRHLASRAGATPSRARARSRRRRSPAAFPAPCPASSAPVDETMRFSSISTPFSLVTSEPVAMTMFLVSRICVLPSAAFTSTLPADRMRPVPVIEVDLVLLEQELDALDVAGHAFVLERHHRLQIELGLATRRCPSWRSRCPPPRTIRKHAAAPSRECSRYSDRCRPASRAFRPRRLSCRAAPRGSRRHSRRGRCR